MTNWKTRWFDDFGYPRYIGRNQVQWFRGLCQDVDEIAEKTEAHRQRASLLPPRLHAELAAALAQAERLQARIDAGDILDFNRLEAQLAAAEAATTAWQKDVAADNVALVARLAEEEAAYETLLVECDEFQNKLADAESTIGDLGYDLIYTKADLTYAKEEREAVLARAEKAEAENSRMESIVDGYVTQGPTNIDARDMFLEEHNKVVALEVQLAEKKQELNVAYGGTGPEAQKWWSALDETRARAEKAEEFAEWLQKWKDAEEALADQKMTALQERNAQLAEAEAAIDETLCHGPFGINRLACFDYRTKYPKEGK